MLENQHIKIPKKIETKDNLDFQFLRKKGIEYIEGISNKLWTDYNSHDPGITTLEVLSYAITDLGMRMNLNMEDILASNNEEKKLHKQFIKASDILPSRPVNELDYRKLFMDIDLYEEGKLKVSRPINNCWLSVYEEKIYADCKTGNLAFTEEVLKADKTNSFQVKGLYKVFIDFKKGLEDCDKTAVKSELLKRFHANRNLCEDLVEINEVETQQIAVCADIEVEKNIDEELVHAKVTRSINEYLSPAVHFYSLQQQLEKGISTDEIFEGPLLDGGFVTNGELKNSQLKKEVRVSDLIKEIMKLDGVKQIKDISIANCNATNNGDWLICIEPGKKPELCNLSSFNYSKGSLPLNINETKVAAYLDSLEAEEELARDNAKLKKQLELPQGTDLGIDSYTTILNEFPDTYGVGENGIIDNPTPERQALAKQLKGYLLFFDKMLAGYFKHLGKVRDLLSVNGDLKRTYFTQALTGINEFDELVNNYDENDDKLTDALYKELDNSVERKNQILDHLIARFSEEFNEYTFLMKALYGKSADEVVLKNKEVFLSEYKEISSARGLGYNYTETDDNLWTTNNISGAQKRIARLLGIKNYDRRNVSFSPVEIIQTGSIYTWKAKNELGNIIFSSVNDHLSEYAASQELYESIYQSIQIDLEDLESAFKNVLVDGDYIGNIKIRKTVDNTKFYFEIVDDTAEKNIIAKKNSQYDTQDELRDVVLEMTRYFKYDFTEEGIFLVENLLLKPSGNEINNSGIGCMIVGDNLQVTSEEQTEADTFMTSCEEGCEIDLFDPYSYRVSVVLPGYTYRFSNPDFRKYAETVIREELPAHVLAKICWVGDRKSGIANASKDLMDFEVAYKNFLIDKSRKDETDLPTSTASLISALTNLNNIYRPGVLFDCAQDDSDNNSTLIIGKSNL